MWCGDGVMVVVVMVVVVVVVVVMVVMTMFVVGVPCKEPWSLA